ncbi:hypothetical protein PQR71_06915 [Paraburkholderia fungorum]|uniref:hypothetical protein n=1 Tax=Paraburkholderia fungorum TaxID=134537 RepID=UPI0038B802FF
MNHPPRKLIPDEQTIVVLDTSPVRNLAYADATPGWVATFADMANDSYSFSLADGACAELLTQHASGRLTDDQLDRIVGAIETFVNPNVPVLPGKTDLMEMIGESAEPGWSEFGLRDMSSQIWTVLKTASATPEKDRVGADEELQEDRDEWIGAFAKFEAGLAEWLEEVPDGEEKHPLHEHEHPLLERQFRNLAAHSLVQQPTLAERLDLQLRYVWRQWVRSRKAKDGYNPASPKKRNDGIDLDLYRYLMLPAFVVAEDGGFHKRIADIKSPQLDWFWQPQNLADAWARGERPRPAWAAVAADQTTSQHAG